MHFYAVTVLANERILHMRTTLVFLMAACGGPESNSNPNPSSDPQSAPTSAAALSAWLQTGVYKQWHCENQASEKTGGDPAIHVHGVNRVCVNDAVSNGAKPYAAGATTVKEVHTGGAVTKLYVAVKTQADSAGGQGWYWYDGAPGETGNGSNGRVACVGCHSAAGADANHPGPGDFVYTSVN